MIPPLLGGLLIGVGLFGWVLGHVNGFWKGYREGYENGHSESQLLDRDFRNYGR